MEVVESGEDESDPVVEEWDLFLSQECVYNCEELCLLQFPLLRSVPAEAPPPCDAQSLYDADSDISMTITDIKPTDSSALSEERGSDPLLKEMTLDCSSLIYNSLRRDLSGVRLVPTPSAEVRGSERIEMQSTRVSSRMRAFACVSHLKLPRADGSVATSKMVTLSPVSHYWQMRASFERLSAGCRLELDTSTDAMAMSDANNVALKMVRLPPPKLAHASKSKEKVSRKMALTTTGFLRYPQHVAVPSGMRMTAGAKQALEARSTKRQTIHGLFGTAQVVESEIGSHTEDTPMKIEGKDSTSTLPLDVESADDSTADSGRILTEEEKLRKCAAVKKRLMASLLRCQFLSEKELSKLLGFFCADDNGEFETADFSAKKKKSPMRLPPFIGECVAELLDRACFMLSAAAVDHTASGKPKSGVYFLLKSEQLYASSPRKTMLRTLRNFVVHCALSADIALTADSVFLKLRSASVVTDAVLPHIQSTIDSLHRFVAKAQLFNTNSLSHKEFTALQNALSKARITM